MDTTCYFYVPINSEDCSEFRDSTEEVLQTEKTSATGACEAYMRWYTDYLVLGNQI
jgi:hypothetical protein